jgi:hypothetical protein
MIKLQLSATEMYKKVQTNIYENKNYKMFMVARQLSECLDIQVSLER